MKFNVDEFSFSTEYSNYMDFTVSAEQLMTIKLYDNEEGFSFDEKEWNFMKAKVDEEFKRLKQNNKK